MRNLKEIGHRLKIARLMTNLTRKEFCDKYAINPHTLHSLEIGRLSLSEKKLVELQTAFTNESIICSNTWILEGKGLPPHCFSDFSQKQDVDNVKITPSEQDQELEDGISIFKEIEFFSASSKNAFVTIINDDAMLPFYELGDYVGGKFVESKDTDQLSGQICIIELKKNKFIVRHLIIEGKNIILSGTNLKSKLCTPLILSHKISRAAKVIWHRSQY